MKIIDIHAHVYPDNIAMKAADSIRDFYKMDSDTDGTAEMLLRRGEEAGISQYLILPVAIKPDRVQSINNYILQETQKHEVFYGFGTVHAAMDGITEEAERIMAMGLRGIKMHPDCQRFAIDDPRLFPVYETVQGRIPVLLHMGDRRYDYSHPARLRKVLDNFPRLSALAAHFGGYSMYETAREYLQDTDCFMDISSSLMFMEPGEAEHYINLYGAERMAFGTDYPVGEPITEVNRFLDLKLTQTQREQIAHKTAECFLHL